MRTKLAIVLTALAATGSLVACGDGDETTTVTTSAPAAETTTSTPSTSTTSSTTTESEDTSGNCDEAEHAEDPECTGGLAPDDSSGSGSGGTGPDY